RSQCSSDESARLEKVHADVVEALGVAGRLALWPDLRGYPGKRVGLHYAQVKQRVQPKELARQGQYLRVALHAHHLRRRAAARQQRGDGAATQAQQQRARWAALRQHLAPVAAV